MNNESYDNDAYLHEFKDSLRDSFDRLEAQALDYEQQQGNTELEDEIRRVIHTIKGEAGMMNQTALCLKCHRIEEALEQLDADEIADTVLRFIDETRNLLNCNDSHGQVCVPKDSDNLDKKGQPFQMKCLIVEDDFTSRMILQKLLSDYAECHIAVNGKEAVAAFKAALDSGQPYDLVCLDIMMPEMDGQDALKQIRQLEEDSGTLSTQGTRIVMTTALNDMQNVKNAYHSLCDGYLVKPISKEKLIEEIQKLGLLNAKSEI